MCVCVSNKHTSKLTIYVKIIIIINNNVYSNNFYRLWVNPVLVDDTSMVEVC